MGRKLIIHAGMHKTGTSAIQDYLFQQLDHPAFTYLHDGSANSSLLMLQAFKHDLEKMPVFCEEPMDSARREQVRERAMARLEAVLRQDGDRTAILSAESICTFDATDTALLYETVSRHFDEVRVVLYVRPIYSRVQSAFQERLKTRFTRMDDQLIVNFTRFSGIFDDVFGREHVEYRQYLRQNFPQGSVVADFLQSIGIPPPHQSGTPANTALSLPAVQLLYIYRVHFPKLAAHDQLLIDRLASLRGEAFRMHSSVVERAVVEREGSDQWLKERAGFSIWEGADPGAEGLRSEAQLLAPVPEALHWLCAQLPPAQRRGVNPADSLQLARLLRALVVPGEDWDEILATPPSRRARFVDGFRRLFRR